MLSTQYNDRCVLSAPQVLATIVISICSWGLQLPKCTAPHPAYNSQNALPPVPFLLPAYLHHHSGKSGGESRLEEENAASKEK